MNLNEKEKLKKNEKYGYWEFEDIDKGNGNLESKIKEDIIGKCPACEKESLFVYIGKQKIKDEFINLYNCVCCHTTRAEQGLWKYNGNGLVFISHSIYKKVKEYIEKKNEK